MGGLLQKMEKTLIFTDNAHKAITENWSAQLKKSGSIRKKEKDRKKLLKVFTSTADLVS